jgi:hypothetical protein
MKCFQATVQEKPSLFLWVTFAFMDPDPDSPSGSESTDPIDFGSNTEPKYW